MIALNPDIAAAGDDRDQGRGLERQAGTFDLSPDVLKAIAAGDLAFAVDQQQYLQGYLPIVFLKLYKTNANTVGGGQPVLTGPGFVDKANADGPEAAGRHALRGPVAGAAAGHRRLRRGDRCDRTASAGRRDRRRAPPPVPAATSGWRTSASRRASSGARRSARCWPRSSSAIFFWTQNALFLQLNGIANWTDVASTIGIPAVVVALLMIGGEFDLSAGVMTGTGGPDDGPAGDRGRHEHLAGDRDHARLRGRRSASPTATW